MRKIALLAPGELELQTIEQDTVLQKQTVKVQVSACGVCGSDLALIAGTRDRTKELYFGHEFSGVITEVASDSVGFQVGQRVASELSRTCGRCWNCLNGLPEYCRSMNDALLPGGFTEQTLVHSTDDFGWLSRIPDTLDDVTASLLEPTNCAYQIARKANLKPGNAVAVFGLGAMGVITGILLKRLGAGKIVCIGRRPARQEKVRKTGIFDAVVGNDEQGRGVMKEIFGGHGPDIAIEATGSPSVLTDAMQLVRPGGTVVVGSVYHGTIAQFDPLPIFRKELTMVGAKGPAPHRTVNDESTVVFLMNQVQKDLEKIISIYPYEDALKAFEDARTGEAIKAVIKF